MKRTYFNISEPVKLQGIKGIEERLAKNLREYSMYILKGKTQENKKRKRKANFLNSCGLQKQKP